MDLIEVLWKQDIDMGVSREMYDGTWKLKESSEKLDDKSSNVSMSSSSFHNPWQGLNYSIDSETGEHIVNNPSNAAAALVPTNYTDITLQEALSLFDSDEFGDILPAEDFNIHKTTDAISSQVFPFDHDLPYTSNSLQSQNFLPQLDDLEAGLDYHSGTTPTLHPDYAGGPSNYSTTENSETLLGALLHNTTLPLPMNESLLNTTYPPDEDFSLEHDTSIKSLLSFLTNDSDPNPVGAVGGQDQNELCPDLPIANLTVDNTFLTQLMNEGTMDFSDFCDLPESKSPPDNWFSGMSSDSAISSIGSDWSDSCSSENNNDENSVWSSKESIPDKSNWNLQNHPLPCPKKYHLFGKQKRCETEEERNLPTKGKLVSTPSSPKEDYADIQDTDSSSQVPRLAFAHNHTYHHIGDATPNDGASQKPLERDKPKKTAEGHLHLTRDEKRLQKTTLPLTVKEIVELSIEHFNERLSELNLSEDELSLIRDIRRRGKNKLAARSCRKRKVDQISDLQDVLDNLQHKRELAYTEMEDAINRRDLLRQKYQRLYQFIFPDRDPPDPVPTSYFQEDLDFPSSGFPLSSNGTAITETENKKRGKHKGVNNK